MSMRGSDLGSQALESEPKKARKGAAQRKAGNECPGKDSDPGTFLVTDGHEQKTAAYVGYSDLIHLRRLAVSWPVLKAYMRYQKISKNLNRKAAMRHIRDAEHGFAGVDPDTSWPLNEQDSNASSVDVRSRHLAVLLLTLEEDLRTFMYNPEANAENNEVYRNQFRQQSNFSIPDGDLATPAPDIATRKNESRLEPINRCWCLLQFVKSTIQGSSWERKFSHDALNKSIKVDSSYIPAWMQDTKETTIDIPPAPDVAEADSLHPIVVDIRWRRLPGDTDLSATLDNARARGVQMPRKAGTLQTDPRLHPSIYSFKDSIRRGFNCLDIQMDIKTLEMDFSGDFAGRLSNNILIEPWADTLHVLNNRKNGDFAIDVSFEPVYDPEVSIFESIDPPPAMTSFFKVVDDEYRLDDEKLRERTIGTTPAGSTKQGTTLQSFLDSPGVRQFDDVGSAPEPKVFETEEALRAYYSGYNVEDEEARRAWQREILNELSDNAQAANVRLHKMQQDLSEEEKAALMAAEEREQLRAIEAESFDDDTALPEAEYNALQQAFSGTDSRSGPPVDICLSLLLAHKQENGLYFSELLRSHVKCALYHFQITGAIGCVLKLYGAIDADVLLAATGNQEHPRAQEVRMAAQKLRDLRIGGAILGDETGFGKTKQLLLAALIHTMLYEEYDDAGSRCYRPILLVIPPTLIRQWWMEIQTDWPYFRPLLSYEESAFRGDFSLDAIPNQAMREYPELEAMPHRLRYAFNPHAVASRTAIVVTTYATHRNRTGRKIVTSHAGVHYDPPRYDEITGDPIWKMKPREDHSWDTNHRGIYSLLVADEAQKIKNRDTEVHGVLQAHKFPKTILATATPMHAAAQDLVGLVNLLWDAAKHILDCAVESDQAAKATFEELRQEGNGTNQPNFLAKLERLDPVRILAMNPKPLAAIFRDTGSLHLKVTSSFTILLDVICIQRSRASNLPMATGDTIALRPLFKQISYRTASVALKAQEQMEYQMWHRRAAEEYSTQVKVARRAGTHSTDARCVKAFGGTKALRTLGMLAFSTKLARLDAVMEAAGSNTHVTTLRIWREKGLGAEKIHLWTRGMGEPAARTARDLIAFFVDGSPPLRLIFQELLTVRAVEKPDPSRYGHHQKLIIGEASPAVAFFLEAILKECLIDARVFHADLSHQAKGEIVDLFNNAKSTLKVHIMLYDVGAVGLNLHKACNRVVISSIPRSRSMEIQLAGRASRITSDFPLTVVRRWTPDSHDQFRGARQADKATVQLAANAQDPAIRRLMVELLKKLQEQVDQFQDSDAGKSLVDEMQARSAFRATAAAETATQATQGEAERPQRERKKPVRFGDGDDESLVEEDEEETPGEPKDTEDTDFVPDDDDPEQLDTEDESSPRTDNPNLEDEVVALNSTDLGAFISDNQPDDVTRHRLALLQLPRQKEWSEADLSDEKYMRIALHLLYNKINGRTELHLEKSIHIKYLNFPRRLIKKITQRSQPSDESTKAAKEMK